MDESRKNKLITIAIKEARKASSASGNNGNNDDDIIRERTIRYFDDHFSVDEDRSDEVSEQEKHDVIVISLDTVSVSYFEIWLDFTSKKKSLVNTKTGEVYHSYEEILAKFHEDTLNMSAHEAVTLNACINTYKDFIDLMRGEEQIHKYKDKGITL